MMATGWELIFVILLSGGGANDMLDWMTTADYWKAKNVTVTAAAMLAEVKASDAADLAAAADWIKKLGDNAAATREDATKKLRQMGPAVIPLLREAAKSTDAEIKARADMLLKDLEGAGKAGEVRRLMAIRTLGELKAKEASAALKGLADSKEPFVAEYAQRALAAIEGKAFSRPRPAADALQKDLWLLPKNCGLVGQASPTFGKAISIDKLLEGMGEAIPAEEKVDAREKFTKMVIGVAERIGNARMDAITMGLADDVGDDSGYVVFVARGQYDVEAMKAVLRESSRGRHRGGREAASEKVEGAEVIILESEMAAILPSNDQLIVCAGPGMEKLPLAEMAKAVKAGKGGLGENAEMVKLIKTADTGKPFWAAARISEAYAKLDLIAAFETITLSADMKDGSVECKLQARGADAGKVKVCVEKFQKVLEEGKTEIGSEAKRMPALKGLVDFLESVQVKAEGASVTGTASLKDGGRMAGFLFLWLEAPSAREVEIRAAPPAAVPPRPVLVPRAVPAPAP